MSDFRRELSFDTLLDDKARDAVATDLDAWAMLIDRGALPNPEYPDVPSVIGDLSVRFEDLGTAIVDGAGMVSASGAAATLLFAMFPHWPATVSSVRFEHSP